MKQSSQKILFSFKSGRFGNKYYLDESVTWHFLGHLYTVEYVVFHIVSCMQYFIMPNKHLLKLVRLKYFLEM